jgi:hypothetical protein
MNERIDIGRVRDSLTDQLIRTYLHLTGKDAKLSLFTQNVVIGVAKTISDPIVAQMVSPEALADFLQSGWPNGVLPDRPIGFGGLGDHKLDSLWKLFRNSEYGMGKFYISFPLDGPATQQIRLRLHVSNWIWKLYSIDLPEEMRLRLAKEILKAHPE